ncbi:hypothetical protein C9J85_19610 [Haloferax sp. wsp5]|nr:hypothetical protein C9J85_19610 [Haloferax sp. wsp5]
MGRRSPRLGVVGGRRLHSSFARVITAHQARRTYSNARRSSKTERAASSLMMSGDSPTQTKERSRWEMSSHVGSRTGYNGTVRRLGYRQG